MDRFLGRGNIESDANNLRVYMAEGNSDGSNTGPLIFANPTETQGLGLWIRHTPQPYQVDVDNGEVLSLVHFDLEATGDATAGILYGLHIETAAATVDKSAGIALVNKGHADSIYIKLAGEAGNPADNSPTGIGIDLNQANDGSTDEGSSANGGHQGLQIYDWSTTNQGVGGPRAVFLNKIGSMDTDHQLLNLRGNRRNLEIITNSATGDYDAGQPVLRLADEGTAEDLVVLTARGWLGVGIAGPSEVVHVYNGGLKVEGDGDQTHSGTGGTIVLQNITATGLGTNNDVAGLIRGLGLNAVGDPAQVADIYFQLTNVTAGAQSSALRFLTQLGGSDVFIFNLVEDKAGVNVLAPDSALQVNAAITVGVDDTTRGTLAIYGPGTTQTQGGILRLHMAADHDGTFQYWQTDVSSTTLRWLTDSTQRLSLTTAGLLTASGGITATGDLTAVGGDVFVGVDDTTRGIVTAYGAGTGQTQGGILRLYMSADHDSSFNYWQVDVSQDTLRFLTVGTERAFVTPTGDLIATDDLFAFGGNVFAGVNDSVGGTLHLYGSGSGAEGGQIQLYFAAPHDGTYEHYVIDAYEDDLRFGRAGEVALTLAGSAGVIAVFGDGSGVAAVELNGVAGQVRDYKFMTGGVERWLLRVSSTAESGSSAGSDFQIVRRDDAGGNLGAALQIQRSSGAIQIGSPTGGFKGTATINIAGDIYKNNSAYTNPDYALELWATGRIEQHADKPGAATYRRFSLAEIEKYIKKNLRLPGFTDEPVGAFERFDLLLEKAEELYTHVIEQQGLIDSLTSRLTAVESSLLN